MLVIDDAPDVAPRNRSSCSRAQNGQQREHIVDWRARPIVRSFDLSQPLGWDLRRASPPMKPPLEVDLPPLTAPTYESCARKNILKASLPLKVRPATTQIHLHQEDGAGAVSLAAPREEQSPMKRAKLWLK